MFCSSGKGFSITFPNEWTVSVQFGYGNYCDNHSASPFAKDDENVHSSNAEVAVWNYTGVFDAASVGSAYDDVKGYISSNEVLGILNRVAAYDKFRAAKSVFDWG